MAELKTTKHAFGSKENIEAAKSAGAIDAYDVLHLSNGEIAWIDKDNNTVINTPRTQVDIVVNGVTGLGIGNGETISAGATIDDIVKMLVQKPIPATYTKPTLALANNGGQASGNVEAGSSITPKLKATFTKNDAGNMTAISIKRGSESVASGTTSPLTYDGEAFVIGDETVTFTAYADYEDAPVKNNNLNQESKENWFEGDTATSTGYSITGKRNLFYGTGVGATPTVTSDMVRGLSGKKLAPRAPLLLSTWLLASSTLRSHTQQHCVMLIMSHMLKQTTRAWQATSPRQPSMSLTLAAAITARCLIRFIPTKWLFLQPPL